MMSQREILTIVRGLHVGGTEGIRSFHQYLVALQYLTSDLRDVSIVLRNRKVEILITHIRRCCRRSQNRLKRPFAEAESRTDTTDCIRDKGAFAGAGVGVHGSGIWC
jgi:hypothetical protein